jgi:hypothetical protein
MVEGERKGVKKTRRMVLVRRLYKIWNDHRTYF